MNRIEVLTQSDFGSRIAEEEIDELHAYFVETEQWRKILGGDVDIVFGSKGAGKSALYSLLVAQKEKLRLGRRTMFLAAENPRGTPAFRDLTTEPPIPEEQFRGLWKLYFLSIAANYLRHHLDTSGQKSDEAAEVIALLTNNGLLAPSVSLVTRLKAALGYIRSHLPTLEGAVTEPSTGVELSGKITLGEPTPEQRGFGFRSLDDLLRQLNRAYANMNITVWLVLDRLDVAFSETEELEGNALRSLFRTYLDMLSLSQLRVKIFLRDDIWRKVVSGGFREASHITRTLTLTWDPPSLLNLIVRRLASNKIICDHYGSERSQILANAELQTAFFYKVFPAQVDSGKSKTRTLNWMLLRTADGSRRTAPRELIHLLLESRDEQLRLYGLGHSGPEQGLLIDRLAIRSALPAVSKARYEQTLCAENPHLREFVAKLEKKKTQQSLESLQELWRCSAQKAQEIAEKLVEAGFFERRGTREQPEYWIPFLYRGALGLKQGAA